MSREKKLPQRRLGQGSNEKKKSRGRRLMIILWSLIIIGILARELVDRAWLNQDGGWRDTEFTASVSRFQSNVMLAHVEWIRLSGPSQVALDNSAGQVISVPMNRQGWPDLSQLTAVSDNACEAIWQLLAEPGRLQEQLSAVVVAAPNRGPIQECDFYYGEHLRFRYNASNGQIYHELKP